MRVTSIGAHVPDANQSFTYGWEKGPGAVTSNGAQWSPWLAFSTENASATVNSLLVAHLIVSPAQDPTNVEIQVVTNGRPAGAVLTGELFGPRLGIVAWGWDSGAPQVATMALYNRRYWSEFDQAAIPRSQRPTKFILVDRLIGGDDDATNWRSGLYHLSQTGITAVHLRPEDSASMAKLRTIAVENGISQTVADSSGMVFAGLFGFDPEWRGTSLENWVAGLANSYFSSGFKKGDIPLFALSDEPAWYYPRSLAMLSSDPNFLAAFRSYLAQQGFLPAAVGRTNWNEVYPIGQGDITQNSSLGVRQLFYWTMRFFSWYTAVYHHEVTESVRAIFGPDVGTFVNFNNFGGRLYDPGAFGNNPDSMSPDAATGAPDWSEFGDQMGASMPWTEDWFSNARAWQWSYYAARMHSIASRNNQVFGGYVVPRAGGGQLDGLVQKVLTLIGNGAKAIYYFTFGPDYNWPGCGYSDMPGVVAPISQANAMIARAEDLLWAGQRGRAEVAILEPRSATLWDQLHVSEAAHIWDITIEDLNFATVDYMAEVFDLHMALQFANIPADFLSEDDLTRDVLNSYKVLYLTEPDVPAGAQQAILRWVTGGGILAISPGAASCDRYDQAGESLSKIIGAAHHERAAIQSIWAIGNSPAANSAIFDIPSRQPFRKHRLGGGFIFEFRYFAGINYAKTNFDANYRRRKVASNRAQRLALAPVFAAGVSSPVKVSASLVETPVLVSSTGVVITLLNWSGRAIERMNVEIAVPFAIHHVSSVSRGEIPFHQTSGSIRFSTSLGACDIVTLRR